MQVRSESDPEIIQCIDEDIVKCFTSHLLNFVFPQTILSGIECTEYILNINTKLQTSVHFICVSHELELAFTTRTGNSKVFKYRKNDCRIIKQNSSKICTARRPYIKETVYNSNRYWDPQVIVRAMCMLEGYSLCNTINPKPNYLFSKLPSKTITLKIILM